LNDICDGFHLDTLCLVYVFEGIELASLFVLNDADLAENKTEIGREHEEAAGYLSESTLAYTAEKNKVKKVDIAVKVDGLREGEQKQERRGESAPGHDNREHP
jgi:hypothetical protein